MTLRVKLEIVPHGEEDKTYEIGRLDIFNKGRVTGTNLYEYGVIETSPERGGMYQDEIFHDRSDGAWRLVQTALEELQIEGP